MTPASCSPSVWGEAGTETITFSFEGTDVTCDVEGTAIAPALSSLTYTGTLSNEQVKGSAPDLTGLTFTAHYNKSSMDKTVTPTSVSPATYSEAGSATVTATYTDDYGTASVEIEVTVTSTRTLDHLTITGDFTNEQIRGTAPDLTGLTIKAVYDDESEETLTSDDYSISPSVWPLGNPDNLGQARVTVSYTEDGVTKTAYKQPTLHYSTAAQELQVGQYGHIYYDFTADDLQRTWNAATSVLQNGVSQGDWIDLLLPDSYYQDGTTYGPEALQADIAQFGAVLSDSGTIGTDGYIPGWGHYTDGHNLEDSYHAVSIGPLDPQATPPATDVIVHILIGQAANNIAPGTGWKLSDFNQNGLRNYVVTLKAPSLP